MDICPGTILCLNAGNSDSTPDDPRRPARRQECHESIQALCRQFGDNLHAVMLQEYKFVVGEFSSPLTKCLPGLPGSWQVVRAPFRDAPEAPVVAYNKDVFDLEEPVTLQSMAGEGRMLKSGTEMDTRYTALLLRHKLLAPRGGGSGEGGSSSSSRSLLLISYHGKHKTSAGMGPEEKGPSKLDLAREILRLVGAAVAKSGVPALVGGDWNWDLQKDAKGGTDKMGKELGYAVQLAHVTRRATDCVRYGKRPIDYFCIVRPTNEGGAASHVGIREVYAKAHIEHKQHYDHDPMLVAYDMSSSPLPTEPPLHPARGFSFVRMVRRVSTKKKLSLTVMTNLRDSSKMHTGSGELFSDDVAVLMQQVQQLEAAMQQLQAELTQSKAMQKELQLENQGLRAAAAAAGRVEGPKAGGAHSAAGKQSLLVRIFSPSRKAAPAKAAIIPVQRLSHLDASALRKLARKMGMGIPESATQEEVLQGLGARPSGRLYQHLVLADLAELCRRSQPALEAKRLKDARIEQLWQQDQQQDLCLK